jgi:hypothetical protein
MDSEMSYSLHSSEWNGFSQSGVDKATSSFISVVFQAAATGLQLPPERRCHANLHLPPCARKPGKAAAPPCHLQMSRISSQCSYAKFSLWSSRQSCSSRRMGGEAQAESTHAKE